MGLIGISGVAVGLIAVSSMTDTMKEIIVTVAIAIIAVPVDAAIAFGKIKLGCGYASY